MNQLFGLQHRRRTDPVIHSAEKMNYSLHLLLQNLELSLLFFIFAPKRCKHDEREQTIPTV